MSKLEILRTPSQNLSKFKIESYVDEYTKLFLDFKENFRNLNVLKDLKVVKTNFFPISLTIFYSLNKNH